MKRPDEPGMLIDSMTGIGIGLILGILGMCAAVYFYGGQPGPFSP